MTGFDIDTNLIKSACPLKIKTKCILYKLSASVVKVPKALNYKKIFI